MKAEIRFGRMASPPAAPKRPITLSAHDDERVDEWAWLRDETRADAEILAHLEAENAYVKDSLAHTEALQASLFEEMKSRIQETDLSVPFKRRGWWYVVRTEEGKQYAVNCRAADRPSAESDAAADEQVLLDENILAGESDYFALGAFDVSPDDARLLYSTDHSGGELYAMKVRDIQSGEDLADIIHDTYYGTAWGDERTFFYVRCDAAMRPWQVWRHVLGTDPADDVKVFEEPDERFFVQVSRTRSDSYIQIEVGSKVTSECWLIHTSEPLSEPFVVQPREQGVEYDVYHAPSASHGDRLLIVTNADGAVNFKIMAAPVDTPGRDHWVEVEPHRPDVKIEGVLPFERHLVVFERAEALRRARVVSLEDGAAHVVETPEEVYAIGPQANPEFATSTLRFTYTSPVTPASVFDYEMDSRERTLLKQTPVLGGYDPERFTCGRLWATAPDGTKVPISYVHKGGIERDGSNPFLLYGYGSYEASMDPAFSILRLSLLERGVVYAIAHIRGGGEMGRPWYDDGKMLHKRNTFTDFIAAAEHVIAEGFTSPEHLAIRGGSAGGLLIGAVVNERPDLFAAAVAEVPFVDCLTTILDETLPLTVTEWEEWGNPVAHADVYAYMKSYSPYDNVHAADYPAILATGGLNDPRVSYWEPTKWVQRLRDRATGSRPVYLKTEMGAGHGGPSGRYDAWKDEAFVFAFIFDALGVAA
jgi:oligopeptidase B